MNPPALERPCSNCGAPLQALRLAGHYGSVVEIDLCGPCHLVWFDVVESARLAQALDPEGATAEHAVHRTRSRATALGCMACGAPVGLDAAWQCDQCGATLAAPGLVQAHRQISALGPALDAHARKPAAHVVEKRKMCIRDRRDAGQQRHRAVHRQRAGIAAGCHRG